MVYKTTFNPVQPDPAQVGGAVFMVYPLILISVLMGATLFAEGGHAEPAVCSEVLDDLFAWAKQDPGKRPLNITLTTNESAASRATYASTTLSYNYVSLFNPLDLQSLVVLFEGFSGTAGILYSDATYGLSNSCVDWSSMDPRLYYSAAPLQCFGPNSTGPNDDYPFDPLLDPFWSKHRNTPTTIRLMQGQTPESAIIELVRNNVTTSIVGRCEANHIIGFAANTEGTGRALYDLSFIK